MGVKFLHTSDWQIGKLFGSIPEEPRVLLRAQRYKTVEAIARLAADRQVDAVLVAGDVFEMDAIKDETILRVLEAMRLFTGPWVLLPGNHDSALAGSVWSRIDRLGCPPNIFLALSNEPMTLAGGRLAVLPAPLLRRHETRDLTEAWGSMGTPAGAVRTGLAHGCVEERLPEKGESFNTIPAERAADARLDYLALGDWHGTFQVGPRTWYSGTPEPDSFKQNDPGNVLVITIEAPGALPLVERVPLGHFRWHRKSINVLPHQDIAVLDALLGDLGEPWDRHVVSLQLAGSVDLATRVLLDAAVTRWAARLHWLSVDSEQLAAQPTEDDLDRIDKSGFVRTAVETLRAIAGDPTHPDHPYAQDALQKLYAEQVGREQQ
jgi:DNA repair exonuclease SbcCD nuclease subunit